MDNTINIISIQNLLRGRNADFDKTDKIKMVRLSCDRKETHDILIGGEKQQLSLWDIYKYHRDQFEEYIKEETMAIFNDAEFVVVFIAEKGTDSRLVGVYKNNGRDKEESLKLSTNYYNLELLTEFTPMIDRVVVDWGMKQQQWHQWWHNEKFVVCIDGFIDKNVPPFVSYEDVMLKYDELKAVISGKDVKWKEKLQSVNCIYAIVDKSNGKLYVGSTYGAKGIWGRWEDYAKTGHGDDKKLKELIEKDPGYANNFQWVILEVLPLKISEEDAVMRENLYKEKFFTRVYGYNVYEGKKNHSK